MGIYLNPGKNGYQTTINSEIFVDKTEMISYLNTLVNTEQKYVSVSRPRRFGKTIAAKMLCAYYGRETDSREMFETLKLAQSPACSGLAWDAYLNRFNVIRVVMTDFIKESRTVAESLEELQSFILEDIEESFPDVRINQNNFFHSLQKCYQKTDTQFVIIIDEWDSIFRERKSDLDGQKLYLNFLRDWLKDREYVALAYMTGILPIKKYGKHSALNMFTEYSMMFPQKLARYTGFTTSEVTDLCRKYGRDFEKIREWYDGYEVSDIIPPDPDHQTMRETGRTVEADKYSLYSPLSVVNAISTGYIQNYWNKTETYEALAEYIRRDFDGLKEAVTVLMDGGRIQIDTSTFQNDMTTFHSKDDILSLLIHLGYLGFDSETSEVFIPNREILDEYKASTKSSEWEPAFRAFDASVELLKATWAGDSDSVAELIEEAHNQVESKSYNDEKALSFTVQRAYYAAQKYYTTILELATGKGYADIVYLPSPKHPDVPALLIELKYAKNADTALNQIRRQQYPQRLEHYKDNLLLIAITYDRDAESTSPDFKRHHCRIEKG